MNKPSPKKHPHKPFRGAIDGNGFDKIGQPDPKLKSEGWAKKRALKDLFEMRFSGNNDDIKQTLAKLFGIPVDDVSKEITYEMIMDMRQMERAILKGDTYAYKTLKEFVHGRAKETIDLALDFKFTDFELADIDKYVMGQITMQELLKLKKKAADL